ncbi:MAG TPA: alpha/beta hydrolase [Candidatus Melainabacteria bacterium]|nr:alpha/beta hydrolase [Candidatus Melainabacteria bacterium]HMP54739.1 alpha/beta hydrolase [Candidatus Melainabacteria bacterium]
MLRAVREVVFVHCKMIWKVLGVFVMFCLTCQGADSAWQDPGRSDYINLPVFFVTDRRVNVDVGKKKYSYGKQVLSGEGTLDSVLTLGIEQHRTYCPRQKPAWLPAFDLDIFGSEDSFFEQGLKWRTFRGLVHGRLYGWSQKADFYRHLENVLDRCPRKEVVIFVHGCCVDHGKAAIQAVNIQKWYRRPVLLYDWGTDSKNYYQSLVSYPRTQDRFGEFIKDLKSRLGEVRLTVVAYSVGANILKDFCQRLDQDVSGVFDDVILLRADTHIAELEKALPDIARQSKNPVQVWVSGNDSQMLASRLLRVVTILPRSIISVRGRRAGDTKAWLESESIEPDRFNRVQILDVSELGLGHRIPFRLLPLLARQPLKEGDIGGFSLVRPDVDEVGKLEVLYAVPRD